MSAALAAVYDDVMLALRDIVNEPTSPINSNVLRQVSIVESERLDQEQRSTLLSSAAMALARTIQDPSPLVDFIKSLTHAQGCTFEDAMNIPPEALEAALKSQNADLALVILHLLQKATEERLHVNWIAANRGIVEGLVLLWLSTEETGVATAAEKTLVSLLRVGVDDGTAVYDAHVDFATCKNFMYRRVFNDVDIQRTFFHFCGKSLSGGNRDVGRYRKSLAQGRLMSFLLQIRNSAVRTSYDAALEAEYGATSGLGLIGFALYNMIDVGDDDVLMAATFLDFCKDYIKDAPSDSTGRDSWERQSLVRNHVLEACMKPYLTSDSQDESLRSASADFILEYSRGYRALLRDDRERLLDLQQRVEQGFSAIENQHWMSNRFSTCDIRVLSGLPQEVFAANSRSSIINRIPLLFAYPTSLELLIPLFVTSHIRNTDTIDRQAARVNYFYYLNKHPSFWKDVIAAATNFVAFDVALAANHLLDQIVGATWESIPPGVDTPLPREERMAQDLGFAPPTTGISALLNDADRDSIVGYLLCAGVSIMPNSSAHDERSAAYRIVNVKHDILRRFRDRMVELERQGRELLDDRAGPDKAEKIAALRAVIDARLLESPLGPSSSLLSGQEVATMGS